MKFANILGSSRVVEDYLRSPAGIIRVNTLRQMFHATASKLMQKNGSIGTFKYNDWAKQIRTEAEQCKKIYRVVVLHLEHSGSSSPESLVQYLKENSNFPDNALFTVWLIPYGFHSHQLGNLIFPIHGLPPSRVATLFHKIDKDTMNVYRDSLRTSLDKDKYKVHWVRTVAADARDGIIHHPDDDEYPIPKGFYTK